MKKNKAFTLIELIAVLVILAILALIVTPLVLNIIKKARTAADKRSIDAYGRSIELAIADYLLDEGTFPTSIEQLTIEYSGDKVECETTKLNSDSSVYLASCTVAGREVADYTYGTDKTEKVSYKSYEAGDIIEYNGIQYYVIKDSDETESSVTLLKADPLTYEEVQTYSVGTGAQTNNDRGIGLMQYHSSSSDYTTSYIKTTVEAWKAAQVPIAGQARLITLDEVTDLGYEWKQTCPTCGENWVKTENTPSWLYNENYRYWTMSPKGDSGSSVWSVFSDGSLNGSVDVRNDVGTALRPVIVLSKSEL